MSTNSNGNDRSLFNDVKQSPIAVVESDNVIRDNTILMKLTISGMSFQKKVNSGQVIDEAIDGRMMNVTKKLIGQEYLTEINSLDSDIRVQIGRLGFRPHFIHSGFVLLPTTAVLYAEELLKTYKSRREELVESLADNIEYAKDDARERLGELFNEMEYPSPEQIKKQFKVDYEYLSMNVPDSLAEIDRDLFLEQQRKAEEMWQGAREEIIQASRAAFKELVDSMVDKVVGLGNGDRKVFKQGFVENMRTFLETFDLKNITGDDELQSLVQKARDVLDGVTPDDINKVDSVRVTVEKRMTEIKNVLDTMVTEDSGMEMDF
jgi:hypothetical protein